MTDTHAALRATLDRQRQHVTGTLEGLSDEQLRRPVLPTGWSCLGLVQHLTFDVEVFWFRQVFAGQDVGDDAPGSDMAAVWQVPAGRTPDEVFARYRQQVDLANQVIDAHGLGDEPAAWPEAMFGSWRLADLEAILLHVIAETACHAGHLDAVRELLDGGTWLRLFE